MPPIRSIAILFHERQRRAMEGNFRIWALAANWRAMGIKVECLYGVARGTDADLLIPHIDLSYLPDEYWEFIQKHPNVVNRRVRDIRKTRISGQLVGVSGNGTGPVIVKTLHNCGGFSDERYGERGPTLWRRLKMRIARHPWVERRTLRWARSLSRYYLFESAAEVPRGVFRNPRLVVERFVPERRGEQYVLRLWTFFGGRGIGRLLESREPLVKSWNSELGEFVDPPQAILERARELGLDYGKMDYVEHEGRPVLIDVNPTPTVSGPVHTEHYTKASADMAEGLAYFEERAR